MDTEIPLKRCNKCEKDFPATVEYFVTGKKHKGGLRPLCKKCRRLIRKDRKSPPVPEGMKRCSRCKRELPATGDYFNARSRTKDHLNEYCRECDKAFYQEAKARPKDTPPETWTCKVCQIPKPFTDAYFPKNPTIKYGLSKTCKVCTQERQDEDRKAHPEKYARRARRWRRRNLERARQNERTWANNNRERRREQERTRRQANPEPFRVNKRRYRLTARGRLQERIYCRLRKARKRAIGGQYSAQDIEKQYQTQKGKCYWCSLPFKEGKNSYQIDHIIPITREGSSNDPWNLVLSCPTCNQRRQNKLPHEWPQGNRLL